MPNRTSNPPPTSAAAPAPSRTDDPAPKRFSLTELFRRIDESLAEL